MANSPINLKQTSKKVASDAARVLRDSNATKAEREAAASALDQVRRLHGVNLDQTSHRVASDAAKVLRDPKASPAAREAAASALVQSRLHG